MKRELINKPRRLHVKMYTFAENQPCIIIYNLYDKIIFLANKISIKKIFISQ